MCVVPQYQDEEMLQAQSFPSRRLGDWDEYMDSETGFRYYQHVVTGETTWSLPPQVARGDRLLEADEPQPPVVSQSARPAEDSTARPAEVGSKEWFEQQDKDELMKTSNLRRQLGTWRELYHPETGCIYFYRPKSHEFSYGLPDELTYSRAWWEKQDKAVLAKRSTVKRDLGDWKEMYDQESELSYFWNAKTGRSSWDFPKTVLDREALRDEAVKADQKEREELKGKIASRAADAAMTLRVTTSTDDDLRGTAAVPGGGTLMTARDHADVKLLDDTMSDIGLILKDPTFLPPMLRRKLQRIQSESRDYPDRKQHLAYLSLQIKFKEWLMASGISDQILFQQRMEKEEAERKLLKQEAQQKATMAEKERVLIQEVRDVITDHTGWIGQYHDWLEFGSNFVLGLSCRLQENYMMLLEDRASRAVENHIKRLAEEARLLAARNEREAILRELAEMTEADAESQALEAFMEKEAIRLAEEARKEAEARRQAEEWEREKEAKRRLGVEDEFARQLNVVWRQEERMRAKIAKTQADLRAKKARLALAASASAMPNDKPIDFDELDNPGKGAAESKEATDEDADGGGLFGDGEDDRYKIDHERLDASIVKEPPPAPTTGVWETCVDEDGRVYYFHPPSETSSWSTPRDVDGNSLVTKLFWQVIRSSEGVYFYNTKTGTTTWEAPDELKPYLPEPEEDEEDADDEDLPDGWEAHMDTENRKFYFNPDTGMSSWERPTE